MGEPDQTPLLWPPLPLFTRIRYFFTLLSIKAFITLSWTLRTLLIKFNLYPEPTGRPTFSKSYPLHPNLTHRFFFPPSYTSGSLLPLYISIHGGGFAFGQPAHDDEFCLFFAENFGLLVISIAYPLTPFTSFPEPTYVVASIIDSILNDESLPIDKSRVAIGGFSAGANLALSACQLPSIRGKIKAAIPWYPPVDWSVDYDYKLASRPPGHDGLGKVARILNHAYLKTGTDQRDPLLSILYADREKLPEWVFCVGAEMDMLCDEARRMMVHSIGKGKEEVLNEGEREAFVAEEGRLRWVMVRGARHGFTHWWLARKGQQKKKAVAERLFLEAGRWLINDAFAAAR